MTNGFTIWDSDSSSVKPAFFFSLGSFIASIWTVDWWCGNGETSQNPVKSQWSDMWSDANKSNQGLIGANGWRFPSAWDHFSGQNPWNNCTKDLYHQVSHHIFLKRKALNQQKHIKWWIWSLKTPQICAGPNPSNKKPSDLSKQCRNFRVSDRSKSIPLRILTVWHTPISKHLPGSGMISTPPAAWSYKLLISCVISASSKYKNMIPYACYSMLKTILISWKLTNIQHPHHVHEQVKVDTNPCRQPGYINVQNVFPPWCRSGNECIYIYIYII